ncbi:ABC transporter permease [Solirubrobacter ginsenosidimutans]|uniref:ABC transporter permease n=1 Tax=Solirubrobacter ginsenosidimutans TaxID=490573 RepID=A0A9X3N0Y8_9ACTN|nr:ABC transporter permease [Solirubrobacter ginsenosidimutans]MDA0166212.1 ABC transporter permease [Solirubrobacter ginsenosidimutans]
MRVARRAGVLIATVLAAAAFGHVFFTVTATEREGTPLTTTITGTPAWMVDVFIHQNFGETTGRRYNQHRDPCVPLCPQYGPGPVAQMVRERVPVDLSLLLGALLIGTAVGVAGGRFCATHDGRRRTRVLHTATALQLSSPVLLQSLLVLFYFSSNASEFIRLPFLSGQGQYVPFSEDPLLFLRAMWLPWLLAAAPLAAFTLRLTEVHMREDLQEDFIRTARAKGLSERQVVNRHALPIAGPAIAAMTGVNVSTLLINIAIIEYAYNIPGLFRVINSAVRSPADIPVLEALVIEGVVLVVLANALADAVQYRLDPRVRMSR